MVTKTQTKDNVLNTGLILLATRKFHKLHQTDFAVILKTTQGSISKFENQLLSVELSVWFRFAKNFKIKDPACFIDMNVEFHEEKFDSLRSEGSNLAPGFDFKNSEFLCTIRTIWPIFEHIKKNNSSHFENFLKRNKIEPEIFVIKNHPLPRDFVETFFTYLKEIKISDEALTYIVPDFNKDDILRPRTSKILNIVA